MNQKKKHLLQQTQALLCKNFLKKWRMKRQSLLEWVFPIVLVLFMGLFAHIREDTHVPETPSQDLGRVDAFNSSYMMVVYTPVSNVTQQIMNKTASAPFLQGRTVIGAPDKKSMDAIILDNAPYIVAIVFNDNFSYKLMFFQDYFIPYMKDEYFSAYCWYDHYGNLCSLSLYWKRGFVTFQTAIDAAIIEITTNHSVMEELMSVTGINMKILPFLSKYRLQNEISILYCLIYFSSFVYFVSLNVTKERKKLKDLKMMGLQDAAFWLSWGLIHGGFIFFTSLLITIVVTSARIILMTGFMVMFTLFFLYGLSLMTLVFLMSVLLKRSSLTSLVVFLFKFFWGCLGFMALYKQLPSSLEWILSICSPFAFTSGLSQIIHLDYKLTDSTFPDPSGDSYVLIGTFSILAFDGLLYLVLALYFDRILPYGNERHYSPLFFLKSLPCFRHRRTDYEVVEKEIDPDNSADDCFEPITPEFQGKEAIRIRNIKKEYKGKSEKVEALKGLFFDVYEGQITAILGPSGAGKSSLLNILNGLSVPTEGSVTIYNRNLSEMHELEEIRKITGMCPQFNIQVDILTVKENLRLFAKIKGIQPQEVEREVQRILLELDMQNVQDNLAKNLSQGQKRKLTFGIAILGDPQVLLLDEPTAGLDPFSRHRVWNFLKELKRDHVILLSTNFTDEADILADRKVIMANGRLKCAGSSLFLKRKWGVGYHLSLYRNETCDPERLTCFVNHHIPEAKLTTESKDKLVYTLPLEGTSAFPDLFSDLDKCSGDGLVSYDVSMSSLSEVLVKLEGKSTSQQEVKGGPGRQDEMAPACFSLPETPKAMSSTALWRLQFCAIARLRFLKLRHERKELLTLLLMFGIAMLPLLVETLFYAMLSQNADLELKPELYFLAPGDLPREDHTSLLIINNTESNIEDFIHALKHQNILLEVDDFENRNGTDDLSYSGAIIVSGKQKDYRFSVVCNTKRLHCYPVLMNIVSNGLLGMFNLTKYIEIQRGTLFPLYEHFWPELPEGTWFLALVVCSMAPYIAMSSVSDYKNKAQSQLWISGLYPSAYWCGQAVVDISLYIFILFAMYLVFYLAASAYFFLTNQIVLGMVITALGYAPSLVFLTYVISFIFHKKRKNKILWSFFLYVIPVIVLDFVELYPLNIAALITVMVLFPSLTIPGFFLFAIERLYEDNKIYEDKNYDLSAADLLVSLIPYVQFMIFLFVLRCLETKYGKKTMQKDPVFRISPQSRRARPNPEEPVDEDEDVQAERRRAATALTTSNIDEKPVIIASCLHKEYAGKKKGCFSKRKKKIAVRNISFCVKKGEILGLLGPNGAGKSSSIRMLSGITKPTAGQVELKGSSSVWGHQGDNGVKFLGYCPQENPLWPSLTVKEHLDVYAAVKGLRNEDAKVAIARLVDAFKLQELLHVPVQKLTAGADRTVCLVLSLLGNSPVLLLDEPFTGLDPAGQQQMWQAIQAAIANTEKGAVLVTHRLAEAEALCDRVAIMVSGSLRCIGLIKHLKSKFGKDYVLELRMKEASQVTLLHNEILKLFPQALRQERYSSCMVYKLPMADVQPLSQAFHKLETVKHNFNLEEYSLSRCTLEQVFLELSKEQELEDFDEDVNTTMRWKLLSRSDDP